MKKLIGLFVITLGVFALAAFASASTAEVLQPAGGGTTNLESLRVGTAGEGGVTFFNGSVLNEGTDTPFTIADDMRVDGAIWRGATAGPGDSQQIKLNDDVEVYGVLTVDGIANFAGDAFGPTGTSLPVAYGVCDEGGDTTSGTSNVTCSWDSGNGYYVIDIDGVNYDGANYFAIVTPHVSMTPRIPLTGAGNGDLIVGFYDHNGDSQKAVDFSFVIYKVN